LDFFNSTAFKPSDEYIYTFLVYQYAQSLLSPGDRVAVHNWGSRAQSNSGSFGTGLSFANASPGAWSTAGATFEFAAPASSGASVGSSGMTSVSLVNTGPRVSETGLVTRGIPGGVSAHGRALVNSNAFESSPDDLVGDVLQNYPVAARPTALCQPPTWSSLQVLEDFGIPAHACPGITDENPATLADGEVMPTPQILTEQPPIDIGGLPVSDSFTELPEIVPVEFPLDDPVMETVPEPPDDPTVVSVPEPSALVLLGLGLVGIGLSRLRNRQLSD
jgi:hypothetical protein